MLSKYKVHEVAKDLNVKSGDIVDLLKQYFPDPKKHSTVLESEELDVIFDSFTQTHAVESFDEYFATAEEPKPTKKPAAKKKTEETAEETKPSPKQKAEDKPEEPKTEKEPAAAARTKTAKPAPAKGKPFTAKQKPKDSGPLQSRTKGQASTIDTRAGTVELDKYNERYESIASANTTRQSDRTASRQKLKQKSQQYRKKGMRTSRKETESERLARIAEERARKPQMVIKVPEEISVGDFAGMMKISVSEVIKKLLSEGIMKAVSDVIDYDTAEYIALAFGVRVEPEVVVSIEEMIINTSEDSDENLVTRDPVVVVMGHVDHGKTSLLDAIRNSAVTETEAGGITQHIGAYRVDIKGNKITFLDTPGHAAFTSMRARGANVTDIAILVVAADDGIMPQTVEAINHAKAADVPIVVAINKMDKESANPERIKQQLTEYELVPEEWGGDTICVPVSAMTKMNLDTLLESVLIVAEMKELRANPNRAAKGVVIEAKLDKGRGAVSTLLVQNGTLKVGDAIVAGMTVGRVRVMVDDKGREIESAGPSFPVEITGLDDAPQAGDAFDVVSDERLARELVEQRKHQAKLEEFNRQHKVTLDNLFESLQAGELKDLNLIIKADVQGSAEALKQNLEKLSNEEVRVCTIHCGVGGINESDVTLADASGAIIIGFNVRPNQLAAQMAERDSVDMRTYRVIYDCIEEIQAAIKGMLAPKFREVEQGRIEVRQIVKISSIGNVAGCHVVDGKVTRNAKIRVVRDDVIVAECEIESLRRFKDDVREVAQGYDCGISLHKFNDIKEGDILEAYTIEEYRD